MKKATVNNITYLLKVKNVSTKKKGYAFIFLLLKQQKNRFLNSANLSNSKQNIEKDVANIDILLNDSNDG